MSGAFLTNRRANGKNEIWVTRVLLACVFFTAITLLTVSKNSNALEGKPQPRLNSIVLDIGGHELDTEVAVTPLERQRGLSFRQSLGDDSGMLFVYREQRPLVFTMRETSIPLAIAFMDANFVILEIHQMKPFAKEHYPSQNPAQYALEVNAGWFQSHDIKVGMRVNLPKQQ